MTKGFRYRVALLGALSLCISASLAQSQVKRLAPPKDTWRSYIHGCDIEEEGPLNEPRCREAFEHIRQASQADPSNLELSRWYGIMEMILQSPGAQADAERRFRTAVRLRPSWPEPYFDLINVWGVADQEKNQLMRQLLRFKPTNHQAVGVLTGLLTIQDADKNADEIVLLSQRYRKLVPFDQASSFEGELFTIRSLIEAHRLKEAAAIVRLMIEWGTNNNPVGACAELQLEPKDFAGMPDFQRELARFKSYCTERDHEFAGLQLQQENKLPEADKEFELQIQANPLYPDVYPRLAALYVKMGQKQDAVRILRQFTTGEWSQQAKCSLLRDFGNLSDFQVEGDPTVNRMRRACRDVQ